MKALLISLLVLPAVVHAGSVDMVDISVALDVTITDDYVAAIECTGINFTGCAPAFANLSDDIPAGVYPDIIIEDVSPAMSGYYTFIGLDPSNGDVVVGLNDGVSAVGNPWPFSTPEARTRSLHPTPLTWRPSSRQTCPIGLRRSLAVLLRSGNSWNSPTALASGPLLPN